MHDAEPRVAGHDCVPGPFPVRDLLLERARTRVVPVLPAVFVEQGGELGDVAQQAWAGMSYSRVPVCRLKDSAAAGNVGEMPPLFNGLRP
jgi:hypothetical protein